MSPSSEITGLLVAWRDGDQQALDRLIPLVEADLRRLAHSYMRRENPGHVLQTTALINEAFLRLIDQNVRWQNRSHFLGIAAQCMRRVLLNDARDRKRAKRGGGTVLVSLADVDAISPERPVDIIDLDGALSRLAAKDEISSKIVELRYFGGLSVKETAEALNVAPITVERKWSAAKTWLQREINSGKQ